jgi:hypothetical protein
MITARDELFHTIESSGLDEPWQQVLRALVRKTTPGEHEALCQLLDTAGGYNYSREEAGVPHHVEMKD